MNEPQTGKNQSHRYKNGDSANVRRLAKSREDNINLIWTNEQNAQSVEKTANQPPDSR